MFQGLGGCDSLVYPIIIRVGKLFLYHARFPIGIMMDVEFIAENKDDTTGIGLPGTESGWGIDSGSFHPCAILENDIHRQHRPGQDRNEQQSYRKFQFYS